MRFMQRAGALLLVATLGGCSSGISVNPTGKDSRPQDKTADTSKGGSKIAGAWTFVRSSNNQEPDWGTNLEFTSDGKLTMHAVGYANAGTYSLDQNTLKINAAAVNETFTVAKLTDKDLVLELPLPGSSARFEYRKK